MNEGKDVINLNAKQIQTVTDRLLHQSANPTYQNELRLLHEYSTYFPMARISRDAVQSAQRINEYMNEPDVDLSPLTCFHSTNLALINQLIGK